MSQKLDSLSKIIIATGQINYMAVSIDSVNEQIKMIPDKQGVHKDGINERSSLLESVVAKLADIMEDMGNLINSQDILCKIDQRVASVPFEIIIAGMDDCEKDYENEQEQTPS